MFLIWLLNQVIHCYSKKILVIVWYFGKIKKCIMFLVIELWGLLKYINNTNSIIKVYNILNIIVLLFVCTVNHDWIIGTSLMWAYKDKKVWVGYCY
ncbi:hypothetical protein HanIR_Chr04g0150731 [Helianthus annuus]|nr:hypothetical protein HanIR_Chr04g0150731 [Helianthus annuus]